MFNILTKNLLAFAVLSLLVSCGSAKVNYSNPKSVTLSFYKSMTENNLEQTKLIVTDETQGLLVLLQTLYDALPEAEKSAEKEKAAVLLKLLKKAKCTIEGETATCTICCTETGAFETETILLKKIDKRWLVHMPKENLKM